MSKKNSIRLFISLLLIVVIYITTYIIQTTIVKNTLLKYVNYYNTEGILKQEIVRCEFNKLNIFNNEFAYIDLENYRDTGDSLGVYFYNLDSLFIIKNNNFDNTGIGATTVTNTTFPELVKMVKKDCSQFQEDYDNPKVDEGGVDWGYREADPPKTEEEIEQERLKTIFYTRLEYEDYSDELKSKFDEIYGHIPHMSNEEILNMSEEIDKNGLNEEIQVIVDREDAEEYADYEVDEDGVILMEF